MSNKLILAAKTQGLPSHLLGTGFHPLPEGEILRSLTDASLWLGPRTPLETDETFRQVIPYLVLISHGRVVQYARGAAGGEQRLHGYLSIGLGGHIDHEDVTLSNGAVDIERTLAVAAAREIAEELEPVTVLSRRWVGLLSDSDTPVGRVHIGVVGIWTIEDQTVQAHANETKVVAEIGQREIGPGLLDNLEAYEPWSRMVLPHLQSLMATPAG